MAEQTAEVQLGESKVIAFETIPREAKTYQVSVDGLSGSFRAMAPPAPATADVAVFVWPQPQPLSGAIVDIGGIGSCITKPYDGRWGIGCYIRNIPPGIYDVRATFPGMEPIVVKGVKFEPGELRVFFLQK